jgi:hypothetical protein
VIQKSERFSCKDNLKTVHKEPKESLWNTILRKTVYRDLQKILKKFFEKDDLE